MDILRYIGGKGEEIEMNVSDWKEENKVEKQLGTVEAKTKAEKDVKPETKESAKGGATVSMPTPMSAPISMPIPVPAPVQTQAPVQMPLSVAPTASISMPVPTSVSAAPTATTALKDDKTKTHSRTSSAAKEAKSQPHKKDDQENVLATKNDERSSADVPVGNSWASLAAKNQDKWGNQKANVEAAVSHVPSVTSTPTPPQTSAPSGGRSGGKGPGARRKETNPVFVKSVPSSEIKAVRAAFVAKFGDVLNCEMIGSSSAVFEFQTVEAKRKALEKKELEISPSLTVHIEDRKARFGLSSSGANPSSGASGPSGGGDGRIKHNSSNRSLNVDYDKDKQSLSASSSTSGYNRSSRNSSSNALGYNSSTNPMNRSRKQ
ncbi:hypothetical protein AX774_g2362 [Zancudomyces culisetae]|uniref:RRM domain-containing protein n=1 Tax=Zancudomyces culisetae TaxID=1213189 RepID=A0A1R1PNJ7_ZANCU|nr:hypothetical protein AX774_g3993 [Zancudomyces culisetae]OMH84135.1 hypothetical protein AX774_g2362 [Zancudomyces culisetae]|eukprot:OMH82528.1 hypothetical protein AX774_g3993 [Zancudomyces culisetae]